MTGLLGIKNVGPEQEAAMQDNILRVWGAATPDQRERGAAWYPEAHRFAETLTHDPRVGAGVIAALSANKGWEDNKRCALVAFAGEKIPHTGNASLKARAILAGADPAYILGGPKTTNFFYNILCPEKDQFVTIDRHAHDIALGMPYGNNPRGLSVQKRYDMLATLYRDVAEGLGVLPNVLQATTWVTWREGDYRRP